MEMRQCPINTPNYKGVIPQTYDEACEVCGGTGDTGCLLEETGGEQAAGMGIFSVRMMPPEAAPKGVPVLVAGGIAMKKTGGDWFTGMDNENFTRKLEWEPKWWAAIPQQNDIT